MPELFRFFGIRFFFFSNEHLPIHVHIKNAEGTAKFQIEPTIILTQNNGIKNKDILLAQSIIEENRELIIEYWNLYFNQKKMKAIKVWFDDEFIHVETNEHQFGKMPIEWFPSFKNKTLAEKQDFELWDNGSWIHWEKIGEDLSVEGFFTFDKNKIKCLQQ